MDDRCVPILEFISVGKFYGSSLVVEDLSFVIYPNEFVTLLGPSGCGKTTTLRLIGGFEQLSHGEILFKGQSISQLPPHKRNVNTVFQRYNLFPHMNVFENIAFGLRIKRYAEQQIRQEVHQMLEMVGLKGFSHRSPQSLSGGQQQRVAIARALVNKPALLLLDEPLGALDLQLRKEMQKELKHFQKDTGITFIYVTHDQEEALSMSDRIIVLSEGRIQQMGTPQDIYNEPQNAFVAQFIGESNLFDAKMVRDLEVVFGGRSFPCLDKGFDENADVHVIIRPEDVTILSAQDPQALITGYVKNVIFQGVHYELEIDSLNLRWLVHTTQNIQDGQHVGLSLSPDAIHVMAKEKIYASES